MPKFSGEGRIGLLMEIAVIILDQLHVTAGYIIWPLFILGAFLIADWIYRGEWREKHPERARKGMVWLYSGLSVVCLCLLGVWLVHGIRLVEKTPVQSTANASQSLVRSKPQVVTNEKPASPTKKKSAARLNQEQKNAVGTNIQQQTAGANSPNISAPNGIAIGGGTVSNPTVNNFAPPARHLSDQQKTALASSLYGKACKITVISFAANVEDAQNYALELRDAFRSAGCVVPDNIVPGMGTDAIVYGLRVDYHDESKHVTGDIVAVPPDTPQDVVVRALMNAHIGQMAVGGGPNTPKDTVQLIVGARPK